MMAHTTSFARTVRLLVLAASAALGAGSVVAEKPPWAGGEGKGRAEGPPGQMKKQHRDDRGDRGERWHRDEQRRPHVAQRERDRRDMRQPPVAVRPGSYFNDGQRRYVRQWYGDQYRAGRCPPGLAKKNNGCMPPGQAKRWRVGHVLPASVTYYAVPQPVLVQLGPPPAGYRYVRVADDILLLSLGTRMVIDAITNLGGFLSRAPDQMIGVDAAAP